MPASVLKVIVGFIYWYIIACGAVCVRFEFNIVPFLGITFIWYTSLALAAGNSCKNWYVANSWFVFVEVKVLFKPLINPFGLWIISALAKLVSIIEVLSLLLVTVKSNSAPTSVSYTHLRAHET